MVDESLNTVVDRAMHQNLWADRTFAKEAVVLELADGTRVYTDRATIAPWGVRTTDDGTNSSTYYPAIQVRSVRVKRMD